MTTYAERERNGTWKENGPHKFECRVFGERGNIECTFNGFRYHFWFPINQPNEIQYDLCGKRRTLYKIIPGGNTKHLNAATNPKIVKALQAQIPVLLPDALKKAADEKVKEAAEQHARYVRAVKQEYAEKLYEIVKRVCTDDAKALVCKIEEKIR